MRVSDLDHYEHVGTVTDLHLSGNNSWITYSIAGGGEREEIPIRRFAMGQLLKFGNLKKSDARDMETDEILRRVGSRQLKYKRNDDEVLAVVSPEFNDIDTNHVHHVIKSTLEDLGLTIQDVEQERGLVTRVWYTIEGMDTESGLQPGIYLRNSVFGASALGIGRFYFIGENESRLIRQKNHSYTKYHTGEGTGIRDDVSQFVRNIINNMWVDVEKIQEAKKTHLTKEEQGDIIAGYADDKRLTMEMKGKLFAHIDHETWGSQEETVWSFIKTLTGYAYHGNLSSQNRKRLERIAEEVLDRQERTKVPA